MSICMNHRGLDVRAVAYQAIEQVYCLMHTTSNKVAEQQDIHVAHMMIGDPSKTAIPNVLLGEQILLRQLILCSIRGRPFLFSPIVGKRVCKLRLSSRNNSSL